MITVWTEKSLFFTAENGFIPIKTMNFFIRTGLFYIDRLRYARNYSGKDKTAKRFLPGAPALGSMGQNFAFLRFFER